MATKELGAQFTYDVSRFAKTDPRQVLYEERTRLLFDVGTLRGVAAGPGGAFAVAGTAGVHVADGDGRVTRALQLPEAARCVAMAADATLYVGLADRVAVFAPDRPRPAMWSPAGRNAVLTSIAVGADDVYVADAGNRRVYRYDRAGARHGEIGGRPVDGRPHGFIVPSPYFDVALGPDGALWVANPGRQRVECCAPDGSILSMWGEAGMDMPRFCGCCNPSHFAIRADGAFVTSEKGLPRVKLYDRQGSFLGVVAGAEEFAPGTVGLDLAVTSGGRVLVLDPKAGRVRVFAEKGKPA